MADIDFGRIQIYVGNYDFWYQASQLAQQQRQDANKKAEAKAKDLKEFIQRFSSNASKARQATARKKLLDKLELDDLPASSRKYPFILFKPGRPCGDVILEVDGISKSIEGVQLLRNFTLTVNRGEKIAFVGTNAPAITALFQILAGEEQPDTGTFRWGQTMSTTYFPKENSAFFQGDMTLVDWLRQYTPVTEGESFARGFLGKMLFSGDEALKKTSVLSGGERVRCLLAKMMLSDANALILDEPTNHLDLESITALNQGLQNFSEIILFSSHDHTLVQTVANRIIEILPGGIVDKMMPYDDYLADPEVQAQREAFGALRLG
jgi:ATPase subunit of ABC transporter with duplicated ATPase domains